MPEDYYDPRDSLEERTKKFRRAERDLGYSVARCHRHVARLHTEILPRIGPMPGPESGMPGLTVAFLPWSIQYFTEGVTLLVLDIKHSFTSPRPSAEAIDRYDREVVADYNDKLAERNDKRREREAEACAAWFAEKVAERPDLYPPGYVEGFAQRTRESQQRRESDPTALHFDRMRANLDLEQWLMDIDSKEMRLLRCDILRRLPRTEANHAALLSAARVISSVVPLLGSLMEQGDTDLNRFLRDLGLQP